MQCSYASGNKRVLDRILRFQNTGFNNESLDVIKKSTCVEQAFVFSKDAVWRAKTSCDKRNNPRDPTGMWSLLSYD